LIGDFTARIGDPSGRQETRKQLTKEEVTKNTETYKKQVSKIMDVGRIQIAFNSEWFERMSVLEMLKLTTHATVAQILARADFKKRLSKGEDVSLLEFMYPLLQGYDSVILNADIELGGTDQIFNLLMGRDIQKDCGQAPQVVLTMPLLEGTDGVQKMSKSYGNYIGINEPAKEMFGKVMSISDELMVKYYELLTDEDLGEIKKMHPKEAKARLAGNLVGQYHSRQEACDARLEFERVFSKKELPKGMPEFKTDGRQTVIAVLLNSGLVKSGNEARRLIKQQAVFFDNVRVDKEDFVPQNSGILRAGARRYLKLII
jgi:tyrosyl-tRNA synthetase